MFLVKDSFVIKGNHIKYPSLGLIKLYSDVYQSIKKLPLFLLRKGVSNKPENRKIFSFIRSPHVNNKSHEQFNFRIKSLMFYITFVPFFNYNEYKKYKAVLQQLIKSHLNFFSYNLVFRQYRKLSILSSMEYSQAVRHRFLISRYRGSIPLTPKFN